MSLSVLKEGGNALETSGTMECAHFSHSFLLSITCTLNISSKLKKALKGGTEGTLAWRLGTQGWHSGEVLGTLLDLHALGLSRICQLPLTGHLLRNHKTEHSMKNRTKTSAEGQPSRSEHRQHLPLEIEEQLRFLPSVGCYMLFQHSY